MDFEKVLKLRQSTRKYMDKQISEEQIERILNAGKAFSNMCEFII